MLTRRLFALALTVALAGCVTSVPPLSVDEIKTWKVVSVEGIVAPVARSGWMSVAHDFRKLKGLEIIVKPSEERGLPQQIIEPALPLEEYRAYVASQFSQRVKTSFTGPLQGQFHGTRPVRIVVSMHDALILDGNARFGAILLSGQSGDENTLTASIDVIDARTGKTLLTFPQSITRGTGGSLGLALSGGPIIENDPMVRMLNQLHERFTTWLLKRA
ncbi:hypothetical protein [Bosea psychrotolerans]|uniref:Lipoprotein n=1 Tax=Bosea psychrotolerans TaxID=1871628 RepID=A0A2S4MEC8_9HYPH|nr:hypothetical protein [Bosea psychrotolerans]POR53106.1 hypothetical protein CYD53_10481 [Bosea psychrotolerans]